MQADVMRRSVRSLLSGMTRVRTFRSAAPPRALFVHGLESGVHGLKARFLAEKFSHSRCVAMPKSHSAKSCVEDYEECLELQREALRSFKPDVIVGSSFGGGLCLDLIGRGDWTGPAVLLCQAFRLARRRFQPTAARQRQARRRRASWRCAPERVPSIVVLVWRIRRWG
eukprot:SAG31_NODE_10811_length_1094_cov_1.407035_1_plen_169_part_00